MNGDKKTDSPGPISAKHSDPERVKKVVTGYLELMHKCAERARFKKKFLNDMDFAREQLNNIGMSIPDDVAVFIAEKQFERPQLFIVGVGKNDGRVLKIKEIYGGADASITEKSMKIKTISPGGILVIDLPELEKILSGSTNFDKDIEKEGIITQEVKDEEEKKPILTQFQKERVKKATDKDFDGWRIAVKLPFINVSTDLLVEYKFGKDSEETIILSTA